MLPELRSIATPSDDVLQAICTTLLSTGSELLMTRTTAFPQSLAAVLAASLCLSASLAKAGTISVSVAEPSTDIIAEDGLTIGRQSANITTGDQARGQSFDLGTSSTGQFEITAITIQKRTDQTYDGDTLTLTIFSIEDHDGFGMGTGYDGADYFDSVEDDTTVLGTETFLLSQALSNDDFVTLVLDSPLVVEDDTEYGFIFSYLQGTGTGPSDFQHYEHGNLASSSSDYPGNRIAISATAHSFSGARRLIYFVQGAEYIVPEPTSLALGLSVLGLVCFRRR